jgi:hypothetical protein
MADASRASSRSVLWLMPRFEWARGHGHLYGFELKKLALASSIAALGASTVILLSE